MLSTDINPRYPSLLFNWYDLKGISSQKRSPQWIRIQKELHRSCEAVILGPQVVSKVLQQAATQPKVCVDWAIPLVRPIWISNLWCSPSWCPPEPLDHRVSTADPNWKTEINDPKLFTSDKNVVGFKVEMGNLMLMHKPNTFHKLWHEVFCYGLDIDGVKWSSWRHENYWPNIRWYYFEQWDGVIMGRLDAVEKLVDQKFIMIS